jgi:CRP-like cAMP-binding protein
MNVTGLPEDRDGSGDDPLDIFFRTLERRDHLSDEERAAFRRSFSSARTRAAGDTLVRAQVETDACTLLTAGMLARVMYQPDGKRHIVAVHVPGDFVDLHSLVLLRLDHDVVALTDASIMQIPHTALRKLTEVQPHLARMLWLLTMIDAATHRAWLARLGHSAAVRIALLFCELQRRYDVVGQASPAGFPLPLTQTDIGDMVGLTPIHVNRTLRKLREADLAIMRNGQVTIPDIAKLRDFCSFSDAYLYLEQRSR